MEATLSREVTRLSIVTRDGAVSVEFDPALDARHYRELFDIARELDSEPLMRQLVSDAAHRWGRAVVFG